MLSVLRVRKLLKGKKGHRVPKGLNRRIILGGPLGDFEGYGSRVRSLVLETPSLCPKS